MELLCPSLTKNARFKFFIYLYFVIQLDFTAIVSSRRYPYLPTEGICSKTPPPTPLEILIKLVLSLNDLILQTHPPPPPPQEIPILSVGQVWIFFGTARLDNTRSLFE